MVFKFEEMVKNKAKEVVSKSLSSSSSSSSSSLMITSKILIEVEVTAQDTDESRDFWTAMGYMWKIKEEDCLHKFFIV